MNKAFDKEIHLNLLQEESELSQRAMNQKMGVNRPLQDKSATNEKFPEC
jgi:hypothetical protein